MKAGAWALTGVATLGLALMFHPRVRCWLRGRGHVPVRHYLGGYRCEICHLAGADLDSMGFVGSWVHPIRRVFSRDNGGEFTRFRR